MNQRFFFERTAVERAMDGQRPNPKFVALGKRLAVRDLDRQQRILLYMERATCGAPLFSPAVGS